MGEDGRYPVQASVPDTSEQNEADNAWVTQVMEALQIFLSSIRR